MTRRRRIATIGDKRATLLAGPLAGPDWAPHIAALDEIPLYVERGDAICAEGLEVIAAVAAGQKVPAIWEIAGRAHVNRHDVADDLAVIFDHYGELFPMLGDVRGLDLEEKFGHKADWKSGIAEMRVHFRLTRGEEEDAAEPPPDSSAFRVGRELLASAVGDECMGTDAIVAGLLHVSPRTVRQSREDVRDAGFSWFGRVKLRGCGRVPT
jgi:hypothetical protein